MSGDKRKKHMRAMEFLRWLNVERRGSSKGTMRVERRRLDPVVRYCVERGLAKIKRKQFGTRLSVTLLDSGLHDRDE